MARNTPNGGPGARSTRRRRKPVAQTGRALGPRALRTRQRIMDATSALLAERSVLDLAVVDIARRAEASPATFYHYFKDVEEVVLALAERAAEEMPAVLEEIQGTWRGKDGLARARAVVDAFLQHWDAHEFTFSSLLDEQNTVPEAYGLTGVPMLVVIDPEGKVVKVRSGLPDIEAEAIKKDVLQALRADSKGS